jgi:hypothetical protein
MMTIGVGSDFSRFNADALERALRASRRGLVLIGGDEDRQRRAEALAHIEGYTALLREPIARGMHAMPERYSFKLVFPDGRWSVDEKQLPEPPSEGDVVVFEAHGGWRIEGQERIGARPAGKPPRQFFVCAPAA